MDTTYCWKLKTENEKHCSEVFFKYVNNAMWPSFKVKFIEILLVGPVKQGTGLTEKMPNTKREIISM